MKINALRFTTGGNDCEALIGESWYRVPNPELSTIYTSGQVSFYCWICETDTLRVHGDTKHEAVELWLDAYEADEGFAYINDEPAIA
jgi:hypothetical protein